ncbi:MAG: L,D-transpeptidase [Clostridia bacterium]|nr:L,D-transpeptidase [Clostridia bacterium]
MRKIGRWLPGLLFLCVLSACLSGLAEGMSIDPHSGEIRPGQAVLITFHVPEAGTADLVLRKDDKTVSVVATGLKAEAGLNGVWWNGTYNNIPAPEGEAVLVLSQKDRTAEQTVTIGPVIPLILSLSADTGTLTPDQPVNLEVNVSCAGLLKVTGIGENGTVTFAEVEVRKGTQEIVLNGENTHDGVWTLMAKLTDHEGMTSEAEGSSITVSGFDQLAAAAAAERALLAARDQSQYTPSYGSPYAGMDTELNYWTVPMDITDEETIWKMLTAPVTVVDTGKKNSEKMQVLIHAEPSENSGSVGVVTCATQGVHVLENLENGWSLIECYSSSFHDSKIKAWNLLVQGYVPTSLLKTEIPNQEIALVVDKLTQRLYIFKDGSLFSTLLVSTGLANARQPYNETRSGEFLLQLPAVGEFRSDNLYCSMGIRFNNGDLIHEVPHMKNADGSKNYKTTEYKLGTRGSHGCIRVQRLKTPEGTNMKWIWNNKKQNMKIVIWEDWQGREYAYPDDQMTLYYNPKSGQYYHTQETCNSAKSVIFSPFTYGELENEAYASLRPCNYCSAPLRKTEIDKINTLHAPGGDHDPVLTEARKKQPAVQ